MEIFLTWIVRNISYFICRLFFCFWGTFFYFFIQAEIMQISSCFSPFCPLFLGNFLACWRLCIFLLTFLRLFLKNAEHFNSFFLYSPKHYLGVLKCLSNWRFLLTFPHILQNTRFHSLKLYFFALQIAFSGQLFIQSPHRMHSGLFGFSQTLMSILHTLWHFPHFVQASSLT